MHPLPPILEPLPGRPAGAVSMLVDADLQVLGAEPGAGALLAHHASVIALRQGRFLHFPRHQTALYAAIAALLPANAPPRALALRRNNQLLLTVQMHRRHAPGAPCFWLHLVDAATPQICPALLGDLFGLTRAEQRVTLLLAQGLGTEDIASRLHVQPSTVRSHTKQALVKTNTRRQAQLVALLWRSAAVVYPRLDEAGVAPPAGGGLSIPQAQHLTQMGENSSRSAHPNCASTTPAPDWPITTTTA